MSNIIYKKNSLFSKRKIARFAGLGLAIFGMVNLLYFFFPFISWQLFFAPVFASQNVVAPVPTSSRVNMETIGSLLSHTVNSLSGVDYNDARNWFPDYEGSAHSSDVSSYTMSIPKLGIENAEVTTKDHDLSKHLVNFYGTAVPPEKGNAVVYGHSTLPQLFDPKNYERIFATVHTLKVGDTIETKVKGITYTYRINSIIVVEADDTSILKQTFDNSYLTIVTCTPPGTIWKRLVIKSTLEKPVN